MITILSHSWPRGKITKIPDHFIYLGIADFLECSVWAHSKSGSAVNRDGHTGVTTRLKYTFSLPLVTGHIPLINCTVHTTGNYFTVILTPDHLSHLKYNSQLLNLSQRVHNTRGEIVPYGVWVRTFLVWKTLGLWFPVFGLINDF